MESFLYSSCLQGRPSALYSLCLCICIPPAGIFNETACRVDSRTCYCFAFKTVFIAFFAVLAFPPPPPSATTKLSRPLELPFRVQQHANMNATTLSPTDLGACLPAWASRCRRVVAQSRPLCCPELEREGLGKGNGISSVRPPPSVDVLLCVALGNRHRGLAHAFRPQRELSVCYCLASRLSGRQQAC